MKISFLLTFFISFLTSIVFAATSAEVSVTLTPAGDFKAKTTNVSGVAQFVNGEYVAKDIKVPLKTLKTGVALRDQHTQKYLQSSQYPEAVLVEAKGKDGKGSGMLKIKGITKPISGTFAINGAELTAEFPVKLTDYEIKGIKYMGIGVDDEVRIKITLPVQK
jgi:polyisoprenoid-binding protein YceI